MDWCAQCAQVSTFGQLALVAMALTIATFCCVRGTHGRWRRCWLSAGALFATLTLGFAASGGMIDAQGVAGLAIFAIVCCGYRVAPRPYLTKLLAAILIVFAVLLATHKLPGFHGLPLLAPMSLCDGCQRFWLLGHLDKPAVGLLLFVIALAGLKLPYRREARPSSFLRNAGITVASVVVIAIVTMTTASLLGAMRWAPKVPEVATVMLFFVVNLFFTTVAEEVFFRMFLHDAMRRFFPKALGQTWQIIFVSATIFGIAHIAGGPLLALAAAIAGLGYAYVYEKTRRIEWAITAHLGVNMTHFLLFSYPRLTPP
ncbi:MAG: CPBP family intramembrane metalloprotease [Rhizobacter sp.]|nr:CPBP family intramembrane metalloprotease [Burkholderiales bacterium]